jgi:hypothetical protein
MALVMASVSLASMSECDNGKNLHINSVDVIVHPDLGCLM